MAKDLDDIRVLLIKHKRDNFWSVLDFLITSGYHEIEAYDISNFPVKMLEHYLITFKVDLLVKFLMNEVTTHDCDGKITPKITPPLTAATENYTWVNPIGGLSHAEGYPGVGDGEPPSDDVLYRV